MKTIAPAAYLWGRANLARFLAPMLACCLSSVPVTLGASFTPMVPLPAPKPIANAELTGGGLGLANFFDGNLKSDFASRDEGTNTVVKMDFGKPTRITAIRHIDRNDPATVAVSEMDFFDGNSNKLTKCPVPARTGSPLDAGSTWPTKITGSPGSRLTRRWLKLGKSRQHS